MSRNIYKDNKKNKEDIKALQEEVAKLTEKLKILEDTFDSDIVDINIKIDNIIEFDSDLLERIENLEMDKGIRRERRKK